MINIDFNNGIVEDFTIVLSDRSLSHKGQISNTDSFAYKGNLNSANEISFTVYKEIDGYNEPLWDDITDLKLVWVKELNEYFEIYVSISESSNLIKNVTGTSLCEAELSQTLLRNIEINSEADIERDDYVVTKFYNSDNHDGSLLHRILEKTPHYSIKHVDSSLCDLQRTFSVDGTSIYDFLTGECSEQFNCLFQFDSTDRSISVYDLYTTCNDCGHRGEFNDICPKCNGTDLKYYGNDTTILVSADNLTDEITFETDVDGIKNCFKLEAGDDNMTAAVVACNPNGSAYLYYFSDEQKQDMPAGLVEKIETYDGLVESYTEEYQEISEELYDCIDKILYYQSEMMPTIEVAEVTASTEAAKLTASNLSPIGLTSVNDYTSTATVNSALKNFAKVFVKTGYVKIEIDTGSFVYVGTDSQGYNYGNWTGRFKVTNYSDEEDIAYSDTITVKVTSDYNYYLTQKVQKNIANDDSTDGNVFDVLSITDLDKFKETIAYYCYNRLESFADAIQGVINVLIEENQSSTDSIYYDTFYTPYYNKLIACQDEMNTCSAVIQQYEDRQAELIAQRNTIQEALNFEKYLGEELYTIFCSYRREDTYTNSNFISDGLDNAEVFKRANEFIELAKQEIVKSGEYQHSISANLYNLLIMKEFSPIKDKFELGNWIRCKVDDGICRLRLISYEINGNSLSSINTEFSDITKTANGVNDIKSILQSAQSMASSYSYVSKQASNGDTAKNTLRDFVTEGLNSALVNIKNNDNEEITIDGNGLTAKTYDDILEDYSPEQLRITHNILAYTDDNWKSVKCALGKHDYYKYVNGTLIKNTAYGLTSDFVTSGVINGSQIIGGEIYSQNYSSTTGTYINLNDGAFSFAGGRVVYDGESNLTFKNVTLDWDSTNTPAIFNISGLEDQLKEMTSDLEQLDGRIQTYSQNTDPSTSWNSSEKSNRVGDIWYDTNNDLTKRWNGSSWDIITDSNLEVLAKSKAQIFTSTPTVPYYVGDLWAQGSSGDILNCTTTRTSGSYSANDWSKSSKYTDDTVAQEALSQAKKAIAEASASLSSAKSYANDQDKIVSSNLTDAYKTYTNSEISNLDKAVANYLHLSGSTTSVTSDYVISPYIGGGYLNIASDDKRVIIDPSNLTGNEQVFQVISNNEVVIGLTSDGAAYFDGVIYASGGVIGGYSIQDNFLTTSYTLNNIEYSSTLTSINTDDVNLENHAFEVRHRNVETNETTYPFAVRYDGKTSISNGDFGFQYNNSPCGEITSAIFNDTEEIAYGIKISTNSANNHSAFAICIGEDIKYIMNDGWTPYGYETRHIFWDDVKFVDTVYMETDSVVTSDANLKNSIEELNLEESSNFIYSLKPSKFKYNSGTSNRYHHGLIAQEVKESMYDDWGLFVENTNGSKGLRYEELIADLIATVQTLNNRLAVLENK